MWLITKHSSSDWSLRSISFFALVSPSSVPYSWASREFFQPPLKRGGIFYRETTSHSVPSLLPAICTSRVPFICPPLGATTVLKAMTGSALLYKWNSGRSSLGLQRYKRLFCLGLWPNQFHQGFHPKTLNRQTIKGFPAYKCLGGVIITRILRNSM